MPEVELVWQFKPFDELSLRELYDILKLRQEIFVLEQDCPYADADGKDPKAHHLFQYQDGLLAAYTRILAPGISYKQFASIGRVVVDQRFRKTGLGKDLMHESARRCKALYPDRSIKISAQVYLDRFYRSLSYVPTGEHYLEDGIPHQAMILK